MKRKLFKRGHLIALTAACSLAGLVGLRLQCEYRATNKSDIKINGKEISLSSFFKRVRYDAQSKDWIYADNSDTLYFAELTDPLYKYHDFMAQIARKPLQIVHDSISVKDTVASPKSWHLITTDNRQIPTINGLYLNKQRKIKINIFIPSDSTTAAKAQKFFHQRNTVKTHTIVHEKQHDRNFFGGITTPAQSPRQLIENMYHDEFIAFLKQLLEQRRDYRQSKDPDCFSFPFMREALKKNQINPSLELNDSLKQFIADGIIKQVTDSPHYNRASVTRAVKNARFGNPEICVENRALQNAMLNKLYTMEVDGRLVSFYPWFRNPPLEISSQQIDTVQQAVNCQSVKPDMLQYLSEQKQTKTTAEFNRVVRINKLLHQYQK